MKMEPTEVSKTSTLSIHTPGNYPKEEITRYSKHGESLKTTLLFCLLLKMKTYVCPETLPTSAQF
jgi:hypothetical protein